MAYLGTRKRVRATTDPSDQLSTNLTASEPPRSPSPKNHPDNRRRTSPSVASERSSSPDFNAQEKALRKTKRDEEFPRLQKSVAELLKDSKATVGDDDDDEGTDPRLTPLIARFSAVKVKYLRQILNNKFDPINISRLCNDVTINRTYKSKYVDLGRNIEVKMKEEDASENDIRWLAI